MKTFRFLTGSLVVLLSGCTTVGPDYAAPTLPEPNLTDVFEQQAGTDDQRQGPMTPELLASWWESLGDPVLTQLIEEALKGNLDIRQAQSRVRVARHMLGISRSGYFPQVDGSATYNRSRSSENMVPSPSTNELQQAAGTVATGLGAAQTLSQFSTDPASALMSLPGQIAGWPVSSSTDWESDFYRAGFDAAWEIDVFGGTRRKVEASQADLEAIQEHLNHVWVSLAGDIAQTYIELRTYQARLEVAESNLAAQEETLELLQSLYEAGLRDALAYQQARYVVESTRATIPSLQSGIESLMNALAVLTGEMPGELHTRFSERHPVPVVPIEVVTGIPADALRQRPDIRVAERNLAAQTARIGEATAELYPKFRLTGSIGLESLDSSTLFESGSKAWGIGPSVSFPIFHAGAIRKNIEVQNELQEQYLAVYEGTILSAVKEVRDALVDYAKEQERYRSLSEAEDAARNAMEVAQDQYRSGLNDFNSVLDAQRSLLTFQDQLAVSGGRISINLVRIYKSLGGGWQPMAEAE